MGISSILASGCQSVTSTIGSAYAVFEKNPFLSLAIVDIAYTKLNATFKLDPIFDGEKEKKQVITFEGAITRIGGSYLADLALGSAITRQLRSNPTSTLMLGVAAYFVWNGATEDKGRELHGKVATGLTVIALSLRFIGTRFFTHRFVNWLR